MPRSKSNRRKRSDRLLDVVSRYETPLIVMHDNPDPDAIATAWFVKCLIDQKLEKRARVIAGGGIVRAENRHMVELLKPPIELVSKIDIDDQVATILVDCALASTNQLLIHTPIKPVAVIDHHLTSVHRTRIPFRDIRPNVAASATIAASYLREQQLEPSAELATAALYAIRTETQGCEIRLSPLDRSIILWLTERADQATVAKIENTPLSRDYFGDLALAIQNTFLYDTTAFCLLPHAACVEIVGEVADLLIRCSQIERVLCGAKVADELYLSTRTEADAGNATELIQKTLEGIGSAGGHPHRAGGKIPNRTAGSKISDDLDAQLRNRWLAACQVPRQRGTRLISRREIANNL